MGQNNSDDNEINFRTTLRNTQGRKYLPIFLKKKKDGQSNFHFVHHKYGDHERFWGPPLLPIRRPPLLPVRRPPQDLPGARGGSPPLLSVRRPPQDLPGARGGSPPLLSVRRPPQGLPGARGQASPRNHEHQQNQEEAGGPRKGTGGNT